MFSEASDIKWALSNEKDPVVAKVNTHFLKMFTDQLLGRYLMMLINLKTGVSIY